MFPRGAALKCESRFRDKFSENFEREFSDNISISNKIKGVSYIIAGFVKDKYNHIISLLLYQLHYYFSKLYHLQMFKLNLSGGFYIHLKHTCLLFNIFFIVRAGE